MDSKFESLKACLKDLSSVAIALSSGVDSSLLTKVASMVLPNENVVAVTIQMPGIDKEDIEDAENFCRHSGIKHVIEEIDLLNDKEFVKNREDRCLQCKRIMYRTLRSIANMLTVRHIADGSIVEDIQAERPARKAQLEYSVVTPLADSGYDKKGVRELAQKLRLPNALKPAFSCFISRIPYGYKITREKIERIKAAEKILRSLGFFDARVVDHETVVIIKLPKEFRKRVENSQTYNSLDNKLKSIGYLKIDIDFERFKEEK